MKCLKLRHSADSSNLILKNCFDHQPTVSTYYIQCFDTVGSTACKKSGVICRK